MIAARTPEDAMSWVRPEHFDRLFMAAATAFTVLLAAAGMSATLLLF